MSIMVTAMASQHNTTYVKSNRLPTFNDYPHVKQPVPVLEKSMLLM